MFIGKYVSVQNVYALKTHKMFYKLANGKIVQLVGNRRIRCRRIRLQVLFKNSFL